MRRLLLFATLLAGCTEPATQVLVIVHSYGLQIGPGLDIDGLRIVVKNDKGDSAAASFDKTNPLCGDSPVPACWTLPVTATLVPGPDRPNDVVVVQVLGQRNGTKVIGDQASFHFLKNTSQRLDFVLYANCLNVDCTQADAACNFAGMCEPVEPMTFNGEPQLDGPPSSLLPDLGGDLARADLGPHPDLSGLPDMSVSPVSDLSALSDLSVLSDLRSPADLRSLADLRPPSDLRKPSDLSLTDLSLSDMSFADMSLPDDLSDMSGTDDMAVMHWTDISPSLPPGTNLRAVWGSSSSDVYVVGDNGRILHSSDGTSWEFGETSNTVKNLYAVWGDSSGDVYAAGDDGTLLRRNGGNWTQQTTLWTSPAPFVHLRGLWGESGSDFMVVGNGTTFGSWDGVSWSQQCGTNMNIDSYHAISATGRNSLLVAGQNPTGLGVVLALTHNLCSSFGSPGDDLACAGGCPLQSIHLDINPLFGVTANSSGGYAVGAMGTILSCSFSGCTPMANTAKQTLYGVWSENDSSRAFTVGQSGVVLGLLAPSPSWQRETTSTNAQLNSVWGENGGGVVFAVGNNGTILRRD
jgi:hypothetical protein